MQPIGAAAIDCETGLAIGESDQAIEFEGLIIDDMGYVQQSREEMDVLLTVLADCYERGSALMTSNQVQQVGSILQGRNDDSSRNRPPGASA